MGLGIRLKEILKAQGLTVKELSEMSGVSLNTLYSITKRDNNMARYDIVKKIAKALDISVEELTGLSIDYDRVENVKNARLHEVIRRTEEGPSSAKAMDWTKIVTDIAALDARFDADEYTEEELKEILQFAEFIKSRRKNSSASEVNAAHPRTDIDAPEGTDTSDNDVMDDEDF